MIVELTCTNGGRHRPAVLHRYDGPAPVPADHSPRLPGSTLDLGPCRACGYAPRPGDEGLRLLLNAAAQQPKGRLDISYYKR